MLIGKVNSEKRRCPIRIILIFLILREFQTFKEISIGGLDFETLFNKLSETGIQFNDFAKSLFGHPDFVSLNNVERVKLIKLTALTIGQQITNLFFFVKTNFEGNRFLLIHFWNCKNYMVV